MADFLAQLITVHPLNPSRRHRSLGWLAALGAVTIWALYFLSLRAGAHASIPPETLALFRFGVPGALLVPVFLRARKRYAATPKLWLGTIVGCGGLLYFLVSYAALHQVPVAIGSTVIPGFAPLFVTLLAVTIFHEKAGGRKVIGLGLTGLGVGLMTWASGFSPSVAGGLGLLLVAALVWAVYTIAVRQSGLKPLEVAALVAVPSAVMVVLWGLLPGFSAGSASGEELLVQMFTQGILSGLVSTLLYTEAVRRIGAESAAAVGAISPVLAAVGATVLLGEPLGVATLAGMGVSVAGVVLASGIGKSTARK